MKSQTAGSERARNCVPDFSILVIKCQTEDNVSSIANISSTYLMHFDTDRSKK